MTGQVLQADLDALGRLKPQIEELAGEIKAGVPGHIPAGGEAGAVPSLAAAQEMSGRTLPVVKAAVAGRLVKVAEMIDLARQGFVASEEQLLFAVNRMPTLQPPAAGR